jgi:hypothetical protein
MAGVEYQSLIADGLENGLIVADSDEAADPSHEEQNLF